MISSLKRLPSALEVKNIANLSLHSIWGSGLGDVYTGTWKDQKVTIKAIRMQYNRPEKRQVNHSEILSWHNIHKSYQSLYQEILVWSRLQHPHILQVIGINHNSLQQPGIVSPYMKNGNALDYVKLHPTANVVEMVLFSDTPLKEALSNFMQIRQISSGLAYLHASEPPILHGDLRSVSFFFY